MRARGEGYMARSLTLLDAYRQALSDAQQEQAQFLADGKAQSFEDYRYRCGLLAGLRLAREAFDRCARKYVEEEGEDL